MFVYFVLGKQVRELIALFLRGAAGNLVNFDVLLITGYFSHLFKL